MKRMLIRMFSLCAVFGLGGFALLQAQRAAAPRADEKQAASLEVAGQNDPWRRPNEYRATRDYVPLEEQSAPGTARGSDEVDPFLASQQGDPREPRRLAPDAHDINASSIPSAADALRQYEAERAARETTPATDDSIRPLAYEETADGQTYAAGGESGIPPAPMPEPGEPTLAPPRDGAFDPSSAAPNEPNLAPPRQSGASANEPTPAWPAELPGDAPPSFGDAGANKDPQGGAGSFGAGAPQNVGEPGLFPAQPPEDARLTPGTEGGNFAPVREQGAPAAGEGAGRPGGKQLEGPQSPAIVLEKHAPPEIQVGKAAVIVLKLRNVGQAAAVDVEVLDQIPKGTQLISTTPRATQSATGDIVWSLGTLKPGEEASVEMEIMPVAEGEVGSIATVRFAAESTARSLVTKPVLDIELRAPREVMLGEDITFGIKVTNTGSGAASGLVLHEMVPELLQHPAGHELEYELGVLKPGESRELELTMRAVKAGRVMNTLTARGEGSLRVDKQVELEVVAPALQVHMEGPTRRYLERQATYTVSVTNPGTAAAKEVALVTHLPPGLQFVEANNSGHYDARTRTVQWLLEELPPRESGSVMLTAVPIEVGEHLVRIESTAERGLAAQEEKTIVVEGVAAIFFEVADVADPIYVNEETTYEIRVVNQGTKAANNVQVVAMIPPELKPIGAEGPARYSIEPNRVLFEGIAQLAPKADTTYKVKVQGARAGDVRVRVQVLTDEMRSPVTKEESTSIYSDE